MKLDPVTLGYDRSVSALNRRGEWVPAIPLPLTGLWKRCSCGRRFWTTAGYQGHYALEHILGFDAAKRVHDSPAKFTPLSRQTSHP